jgi:short subunit dehydrogenase-like uncharacterized protein
MIDQHQSEAKKTGAILVSCCGFDSIPSDLGVSYLQRQAKQKFGNPCQEITMFVKDIKGGVSGGTLASLLNIFSETQNDKQLVKLLGDPYALNPTNKREGKRTPDQKGVRFNSKIYAWTAPFVMAFINTRVVRRTNALLGYPYGSDFAYYETMSCGWGLLGWCRAAIMSSGQSIFLLLCAFSFTRRNIVQRLVPKPGDGPNQKKRKTGYFVLLFHGKLASGESIKLRVTGDLDPGYGSTSKMIAESAVCLANYDLGIEGGCWTPASAMGPQLQQRLTANSGLSFVIEDGS